MRILDQPIQCHNGFTLLFNAQLHEILNSTATSADSPRDANKPVHVELQLAVHPLRGLSTQFEAQHALLSDNARMPANA